MNHLHSINVNNEEDLKAIQIIKDGQSDRNIQKIYNELKDNPLVKWKDSIKKVVGIESPSEPGLDI